MATRNKAVFEVVASAHKTVILAGYDTSSPIPNKTTIGYHKCSECKSEVILNCMEVPACPVCASSLNNLSEDTNIDFKKADFGKLKALCDCETCGTSWMAKAETVAAMKDKSFYCPSCTTEVQVEADDDSKDDSSDGKDTGSTPPADPPKDDSDKSGDDSSNNDDEADKELDETLKKLKLKDKDESDSTDADKKDGDDSSKKDTKKDSDKSSDDKSSSEAADDDEDEDEDSNEDDSSDDDDDDETEVDASELIYHMALKDAKKISIVATENYENWFMFSDKTPVAVASFENAAKDIKPIFRSQDYVVAFNSSVANDGGVNEQLMKDFGMTPVKIDLNIDNVTKRIIDEQVEDKTKDIKDKLESLSSYFESSIGIASVGIVKGMYPNGEDFRTALVASFGNNGVRQPERLVDEFLAKNLPGLMKNTIILAKELMEKSPEALNEVASMVEKATARAVVVKTDAKVPPLAVHASKTKEKTVEKPENDNLGRESTTASAKKSSAVVGQLFSNIKTRRG